MISAFGAAAHQYAGEIDDVDAIVTDLDSLAPAYLEAVRRREQGTPFYVLVVRDERRLIATYEIAQSIVSTSVDPDQRELQLKSLGAGTLSVNGRPFADFVVEPGDHRVLAYELCALADAVLVRSHQEYRWIFELFTDRPAPLAERIVATRTVPEVDRAQPGRPSVVVWAPRRRAEMLSLHAAALIDVRGDVTFVAGAGELPAALGATVVSPHDARVAGVLAQATCIVCAEPNDPADAVAFARLGYGVVAPVTSGAHEFVRGVAVWDGVSAYALYANVLAALGRSAVVAALPPPPPPLQAPAAPAELPLVSVILPTYNRRDLLARVLQCLASQTYPRLEVVVINDGGVAVDDVVAPYPFARLLVSDVNRGAHAAVRSGFDATSGDYVAFLPDDDWLYPDHIARIMDAILQSGAAFGHSCALLRYLRNAPDGSEQLRGFNARTFSKTMNRFEVLLASPVSVNQCIQHRRVFDEVGWFLETSVVADNEFHVRLLERYTPVFVPQMTCEFRDHERGNTGKGLDLHAGLVEMYEVLHPRPGRPFLTESRRQTLQNVARRTPGASPFPPTLEFGPSS